MCISLTVYLLVGRDKCNLKLLNIDTVLNRNYVKQFKAFKGNNNQKSKPKLFVFETRFYCLKVILNWSEMMLFWIHFVRLFTALRARVKSNVLILSTAYYYIQTKTSAGGAVHIISICVVTSVLNYPHSIT